MLATFVIGLREGLEAALIVGIIAAFLVRTGRRDALRSVWAGVAVAILLSLAVGVLLQLVSSSLPQRQQEMLECVVAAIAVVMVSYMVLWMKAHSRSLKSDLQGAAGSALARGSALALVVMAFLAVIREGFETAVFLLAAFQSTASPALAAIGVLLGLAVAVTLGYLVYRGGLRLNLSRFFRITGVVLVLVAAGLVASTLRAAYEAGWLTIGQQTAIDLSAIARPGSVQESLLTGMLGIRSSMPVVEVIAYLLYAIPMLAVVLWPPKRTPSRRAVGTILVSTAVAALAVAGTLVLVAPSAPAPTGGAQGPYPLTAATAADGAAANAPLTGTATVAVSPTLGEATIEVTAAAPSDVAAGGTTTGSWSATVPILATGHDDVVAADGSALGVTVYSFGPVGAPVDPATAGLPAALTADQLAELNGGRLPVGVRSDDSDAPMPATYSDSWSGSLLVHPTTGSVLGLTVDLARSAQVTVPSGATVSTGSVVEAAGALDGSAGAPGLRAVQEGLDQRTTHQVVGQVIPGLLVVFAIVLLAFGLPKLLGSRRTTGPPSAPPVAAAASPPPTGAPATVSPTQWHRPPWHRPPWHRPWHRHPRYRTALDPVARPVRAARHSFHPSHRHHRGASVRLSLRPGLLIATAGVLVLSACSSGSDSAGSSSAASAPSSAGSTAGSTTSAVASAASSSSAGPGSSSGAAGEVQVLVTEADGCIATPDTVPAGQVTFVITNVDALGVTEVELVSDQRIVGERENLAPGFDSTFSVRLDGGTFEIFCPGAGTERRPFTVTGEAAAQSGDLTELLGQATVEYGAYVDEQVAFLLEPVRAMATAIKAGDLAAAQAAYIKARPFYERIEPVAESFPELDPAIDLRIGDVEAGATWTGFHPIEQGLFEQQSTDGLADLADQLIADCESLQAEAKALSDATVGRHGRRLPGVRDRQRRRHPARRGAGVQDHRRGGGVLADRPARFRGERRGLPAGVRDAQAGARHDRPDGRAGHRGGVRRPDRGAGRVP